jgi:diguanylate cyclase (GGDEF)-like protein
VLEQYGENMVPEDLFKNSSDTAFARQLKNGYSKLRFEEDIERRFLAHYIDSNLAKLRWSVCVAILLFILFAVLDAYLLPVEVAIFGAAIRAVVVMALGFNLFATFVPNLRHLLQVITTTTCVIAGMAVIFIIYLAQYYGVDIPFTGMLLIVSVFYFLSGLLFRASLFAGVVTLCVYVLLGLLFDSPAEDIIYNSSFLIAANMIGCVGCYSYEHSARTNFLTYSMLNDVAERDSLTGLFNRRAFDKYLKRLWRLSIRQQTSLSVVMIDVDHFKQYNDWFGHQMGDQALTQIADVLKGYFQRPTDLIARYGGEEFIGVFGDVTVEEAKALLEKVRSDVELKLALPQADNVDHNVDQKVVTVSIGMTHIIPTPEHNLAEQIEKSDKALYVAKARGRNRIMVE